jgi:hypothetical protein
MAAPAAEKALFRAEYDLTADADVSVTVLDISKAPIHTFNLALGQDGTRAGHNGLILWNGRNAKDEEAPPGEYWASVSVRYPDGRLETKRFRWMKD